MTPDQIALIRTTHAMIRPVAAQAALLVETRLAEITGGPAGAARGIGILDALDQAVGRAASLPPDAAREAFAPLAEALETEGAGAGPAGEALLWALERGLGPGAFTPPVREAWAGLLDRIATQATSGRNALVA